MQTTEKLHPEALGLDEKSDLEILTILYEGQIEAARCVNKSMAFLEAGAKAMANAVLMGNKLIYAAAGSSGLQGMADGLELTPTFGIPISQIKILRAGGIQDMSQPKGNMEDSKLAAISDAKIIKPGDCVICLAASGVFKSNALILVIGCQFIFAFGEMIWSPILPSVVNQLAPDNLRGRYNAAGTNAWQIALIAGPTIAGTMLGANAHWLWLSGLIIGLLIVSVAAQRLKLPDRPVSTVT